MPAITWWRSAAARILVAVTRWTVRLAETGWGNTVCRYPSGSWTDTLTGAMDADRRRPPSCSRICPSSCWSAHMTEFRVWAPKPELVRLDVEGAVHPMTRVGGRLVARERRRAPDARYGYLLDDDPPCCPTRVGPSTRRRARPLAVVGSARLDRRETGGAGRSRAR